MSDVVVVMLDAVVVLLGVLVVMNHMTRGLQQAGLGFRLFRPSRRNQAGTGLFWAGGQSSGDTGRNG